MTRDVVERRDRRARRHERARAHAAQAEDAVEGRRDHAVRELGAHDVHARLRGIARRALRVELALGDDLRLGELLPARELALGFLVGRPRLLEPGELRAAREVDDHVAGTHDVAAVESDLAHRLADLRRQRDRFLGSGRAERLDRVAPFDRRDAGHDHGRCRRRLAAVAASSPQPASPAVPASAADSSANPKNRQCLGLVHRAVHANRSPGPSPVSGSPAIGRFSAAGVPARCG